MSPLERFKDFNVAYQGMFYPMELDHMGHANVRYYSRAFNEAAYFTFTTVGLTPAFMRAEGRGMGEAVGQVGVQVAPLDAFFVEPRHRIENGVQTVGRQEVVDDDGR